MSRLQNFVYYRSHITHPPAVGLVKNKKCLVFKNEKEYLFSSVNCDINVFVISFFWYASKLMLSRRLQNILTYISVLGINSEEIDIRYSNTSLKFGRVFVVISCSILFKCSM